MNIQHVTLSQGEVRNLNIISSFNHWSVSDDGHILTESRINLDVLQRSVNNRYIQITASEGAHLVLPKIKKKQIYCFSSGDDNYESKDFIVSSNSFNNLYIPLNENLVEMKKRINYTKIFYFMKYIKMVCLMSSDSL